MEVIIILIVLTAVLVVFFIRGMLDEKNKERDLRRKIHESFGQKSLRKKDDNDKNQPYKYSAAPDLLVVTVFKSENEFGQFILPKEELFRQSILISSSTKGKMALRVYPSWDIPTSNQATKTQEWQLPYFVDMSDPGKLDIEKLMRLYSA